MHPSEQFIDLAENDGKGELLRQWQDRIFHAVFVRDAQGEIVPAVANLDQHMCLLASTDFDELEQLASGDVVLGEGGEKLFISSTLQQLALFCTSQGLQLNWAGQQLILNADMLRFMAYSTIQHTKAMGETLIESNLLSFGLDEQISDPSRYCDGQQWILTALDPAHPHAGDYPDEWLVYAMGGYRLIQTDVHSTQKILCRTELEPALQSLYDRWATKPSALPEQACEAERQADSAAADVAAAQTAALIPEPVSVGHKTAAPPASTATLAPSKPPSAQSLNNGPSWPLLVLFFAVLGAVIIMAMSL